MAVRKILGVQNGSSKTVLRVTDAVPTNGQVLTYNTIDNAYVPATLAAPSSIKAGKVVVGSFSGSPKKATVIFSTAMPDANYIVTVSTHGNGTGSYVLGVESITTGGFVINAGTNNITGLVAAHWVVMSAYNP